MFFFTFSSNFINFNFVESFTGDFCYFLISECFCWLIACIFLFLLEYELVGVSYFNKGIGIFFQFENTFYFKEIL